MALQALKALPVSIQFANKNSLAGAQSPAHKKKKMKTMNYSIRILSLIIMTATFIGCSNDDDSLDEVAVYSATINGSELSEGLSEVPLNGTIEIAFSRTMNAENFENSFS